MEIPNKEWWSKAQRARDGLFALLRDHPDVSLVDIGLDPLGVSNIPVLRIHLRRDAVPMTNFPREIDGIPVRVIHGDYRFNIEIKDEEEKIDKTWSMSKGAAPIPRQLGIAQSSPAALGDRDDLTVIDGINPVIEMALNSIGVRTLSDFAGYSPEILAQALQRRTGLAVTAEAITRQNWIASAALLAGASASTMAADINDEVPGEVPAMHTHGQNGNSSTSGALEMPETTFQAAQQENVVERVIAPDLDDHVEQSKTKAGSEEMVLRIQGVRFEQFEMPATNDAFPETRLRSEISCGLTRPHMLDSTVEETFICAQIYAVNTATSGCALLVFQTEHLQSNRADYRFRLEFKVPEVGNYQLQVVAFLLHPVAKVAFYQGPSLRVIA